MSNSPGTATTPIAKDLAPRTAVCGQLLDSARFPRVVADRQGFGGSPNPLRQLFLQHESLLSDLGDLGGSFPARLWFVELGPEVLLLGVATLAAAVLASGVGAWLYRKVSESAQHAAAADH